MSSLYKTDGVAGTSNVLSFITMVESATEKAINAINNFEE